MDCDAAANDDRKDIGAQVRELIVASEGELERDAKAFDGHDGNGACQRADGHVDQWRLGAVCGADFVDEHEADGRRDNAIEYECCARISVDSRYCSDMFTRLHGEL